MVGKNRGRAIVPNGARRNEAILPAMVCRRALVGLWLLAGLVMGLSTGCGVEAVRIDQLPREYVANDYERVLRSWTRSGRLIRLDNLDNVLTVTATYESWDFRWAYVVRYAEDYRLTVDQRRSLLERSLAESRQEHQFFVALFAERYKWGDLTADNPAWIVRLIDDVGTETAPLEIVRIKDPGAIEYTYFPYTNVWRMTYRVRFPVMRADQRRTISEDARWFGLRFTGPQGHQELVWYIDRDDAPGARPSPQSDAGLAMLGDTPPDAVGAPAL